MELPDTSMSGDFILDGPVPPKLDLTGARSRFYRSPRTPSAASSLHHSVSPSQSGRKRARRGYDDCSYGVGGGVEDRPGNQQNQFRALSQFTGSSNPPVNTDYALANGGLNTSASSLSLSSSVGGGGFAMDEGELDYRRNRPMDAMDTDYRGAHTRTQSASPLKIFEGSVRKRGRRVLDVDGDDNGYDANDPHIINTTPSGGWGKTVFNLVGDVAGKVWDFCWSGPLFRGFYAGGGMGYEMTNDNTTPAHSPQRLQHINRIPSRDLREETPVPGRYPSGEYNYLDGQTSQDDIAKSWVLVKNDQDSRETSPSHSSRKIPRRSSVVHHVPARRRTPRIHTKRASLTPSRPSTSAQPYSPHSLSYKTSPLKGSGPLSDMNHATSPMSQEAQRHAAKLRRKEREDDASIRRLNQQLKDLIREGKEALGTRIEVEQMDMGEWD